MKRILLFPVTLILLFQLSCSTGNNSDAWISYASPEREGLSNDSLMNIGKLLKEFTDSRKLPGGAALVAKNGKIVYEVSFGFRDIEKKIPLEKTDLFRIASMTKPIVTVAAMQLYEKGRLKLTDPVSKYIPSFSKPTVLVTFNKKDSSYTSRPASREVTITDLLTHTSGIGYSFSDSALSAIYAKNGIPSMSLPLDLTIEKTMSGLGELPLAFEPGTKFLYGLNTDVLGRVVEVASGMSLSDYIEKNITGPLKMNDTRFYFDSTFTNRLTTLYASNHKDSSLVKFERLGPYTSDFPVAGAKKYFSGGSGITCTMQDYFIFCQALLNKGTYNGVRILSDTTVALMFTDHLGALRWNEFASFGYGFRIVREKRADGRPGRVIDLGWAGAFSTWFSINPAENEIAIFMTQVLNNPYSDIFNYRFDKIVRSANVSAVDPGEKQK